MLEWRILREREQRDGFVRNLFRSNPELKMFHVEQKKASTLEASKVRPTPNKGSGQSSTATIARKGYTMGEKINGNGSLFDEPVTCADALRMAEAMHVEARALSERATKLFDAVRILAASQGVEPLPTPMQVVKHHPITSVLKYFDVRHRSKFGDPAKIDGGKDSAIIKRLLVTYDEGRICELIELFFECEDEFLTQRTGFTIGAFSSRVAGLISSSRLPTRSNGVTRNTESNGRQATAAVGMIKHAYGNGR